MYEKERLPENDFIVKFGENNALCYISENSVIFSFE